MPATPLHQRNRQGQSTVEYLLLISVVVIGVVFIAGDAFQTEFEGGLQAMQDKLGSVVEDGHVDGH
jgi:hypothetical protein